MDKKQIKEFLREKNLHPIKRFGQNFLINQNTIQNIVKQVQKNLLLLSKLDQG